MRGKYITTSLKLAVLAGSKKHKTIVNETKAVFHDHQIIWSKNSAATQKPLLVSAIELQLTEAI
jgi:hypothetical protein